MDKKKTALITGASSGIGLALANVFAKNSYDLVLVARDRERLEKVKTQIESSYGIAARIIAADLSKPSAPADIFSNTESAGIEIDVLVNNAGFAEYGPFAESDLARQLNMVALNITALTELTHLFLRAMAKRSAGKILNVASTAAFQPGPLMAVYYASKAYVLSFSEAINEEMRGTGVTMTALCPGPTKTEFAEKQPQMKTTRLFKGSSMSAEEVAVAAYHGLMREKAVVIPGLKNKLLAWSTRFGPRVLVIKISHWILEQK